MSKKPAHSKSVDLRALAEKTMTDEGFVIDWPAPIREELRARNNKPLTDSTARDLRSLLWSSIDDGKTRDLDQVEFAEELPNGDVCLSIGVADVDAFVQKNSEIDKLAAANCTSVYAGVKTFPMLPEELSTDLTSLVAGEDRYAVVTQMVVAPDGSIRKIEIHRAIIRNRAKLSYEKVGDWLDGKSGPPDEVTAVPGLESQIKLQARIAERFEKYRKQHGSLELGTIQSVPVTDSHGAVVQLKVVEPNCARDLIANFMIAANVAMATFLEGKGGPSLRRVVRSPEHWDRIIEIAAAEGEQLPSKPDSHALSAFLDRRKKADPIHFPDLSLAVVKSLGPGEYMVQRANEESEGHFGLAVQDYTHSTAPNRRYADLVTQRLVKASIGGEPSPYSEEELAEIAARCTEREDAARKVERKVRKIAAAVLLGNQIGKQFDAIVTGVSEKGTFARALKPPVDGRVVRGEHGMRVGDKVKVRLLSTDPRRGFIDFARA